MSDTSTSPFLTVYYSTSHSVMQFSEEFTDTYTKRTGLPFTTRDRFYDRDDSTPVIRALVSELGRRAFIGDVDILYIPIVFRQHYTITKCDGFERIHVNVLQAKGFLLDSFMMTERGPEDRLVLDAGYRVIMEGIRQFERMNMDE